MIKIKQPISGLITFLVVLWISTPIIAQNNTQTDTSQVYELDEVIISASRYEEPTQSVGRNITVIGKSEIENAVQTSVGGLLAQQQGIHLVGNNQTPGSQQSLFLRNTNSNHTVVMIDGIRISDPSSSGNSIDLSEISLAGVERIEVVRGAHSTLYGSSAIGGVINIITQKSRRADFNVDLDSQFGRLKGGVNSIQNNLSLKGSLENGFYTNFSMAQNYTNGLDATIDTTTGDEYNPQDRDGFQKFDVYGKLGYSSSKLAAYGAYRRIKQTAELDQGAYDDDDNAEQNFARDLFNYGVSYNLSDRLSLDFTGGFSTLNRTFVNDSSQVNDQGEYDGINTETEGSGTLWENELMTTFSTNDVKLILGVSSSRQTMNNRSFTYLSSSDLSFENNLDSLNLKETISGIFLHTDLNGSLLNEKLDAFSLVLGSRFSDHNRFGSHVTYEINPRLELSTNALVYASATTGFNVPSLYQLHSPQQSFGAFTSRGNSDLKPEESISYEVGWKQNLTDEIRFELSLFRTNVKNVIEYVYLWNGDTDISNLSGTDFLGDTYINVSRQHINGLELGVNIRAISNFSIDGNLSYAHSESVFAPGDIDESYTGGNHVQIYESGVFVDEEQTVDGLTRRPSLSANIKIDYLPTAKWRISLATQFVGSRDDIFFSSALAPGFYGALDRSNVSSYNLTDLSFQYRLNQNISFTARINNLFDTDYTEIIGYQTRGRGVFLKTSLSF